MCSNTLRGNLRIGNNEATDAQLNAVLAQVGLENLLDNDRAWNAGSAKAAVCFPAANSAVSVSPAPCCIMRRSCCSMSRQKTGCDTSSIFSPCCGISAVTGPCLSSPTVYRPERTGHAVRDGRRADSRTRLSTHCWRAEAVIISL